MNTDGQKKQGRVLKKNAKLLSSVSLMDFSFEQISTNALVSFDNAEGSIIHSRYHEPDQLGQVVKQHDAMNEPVYDAHHPHLGVIFPADFTQDWHNERLNSKRRALGIDDDEEIDILEEARSRNRTRNQRADTLNVTKDETIATDREMTQHDRNLTQSISSPDVIRPSDLDPRLKSLNEGDMASAINKAFLQQSQSSSETASRTPLSKEDTHFEPLPTDTDKDIAIEDQAIEQWRAKQNLAKQNEQLLEELRNEARSEGFQAGFREGEEKGMLSGQRTAAQVYEKVSEILIEFSGLKELILMNVQKNFYELSQAISEALLGREFSIRPEAYATMIQRVIKDTVTPNEFKIKLHPETWQKVHDLSIPDLDQFLVKDTSIPLGDFRVESHLTVVDVSAKKLVTQLLEKTDINLFDEKKVS